MPQFVSLAGFFAFVLITWCIARLLAMIFSAPRPVLNWRLLCWGLGIQLAFGFFVFRLPAGRALFARINAVVIAIANAALKGPQFVFGGLADSKVTGEAGLGYILAAHGLMTVVVFSSLIAVLYYCGIMQLLIRVFAYVFTKTLRISGAESLCAASNIFVGVESALAVKPYLKKMTRSELCTMLTVCMASVASNVMALYISFLGEVFPQIAGHLISASILSIPAAIVVSKVILPETEEPVTMGEKIEIHSEPNSGLFEAIINGANSGMKLVIGIVALLVAVKGLVAIVDLALVNIDKDWSLNRGFGIAFRPFTFLMGVSAQECKVVAEMVGQRLVTTEVDSYISLNKYIGEGLSARSAVIAAYALCGFAHIPSLGIFVGGISALVPEQKSNLAAVAPRALFAATVACLMTGCVAGIFYNGGSLLIGSP